MGKLYNDLQIQLKTELYKSCAEDCIKIYEKLKEMGDGHVWESDWKSFVKMIDRIGTFPNSTPVYQPTPNGYLFLKGFTDREQIDFNFEQGNEHILVWQVISNYLLNATNCMNFIKQLSLKYPDINIKVSRKELQKIWIGIKK